MAHILPLEFDLHVSKRPGANGRPDQFTIAIWDGVHALSPPRFFQIRVHSASICGNGSGCNKAPEDNPRSINQR